MSQTITRHNNYTLWIHNPNSINLSDSFPTFHPITITNPCFMDTLSNVITSNITLQYGLTSSTRSSFRFSHSNPPFHSFLPSRIDNKVRVFAKVKSQNNTTAIDFSDPDWKTKFKQDFEARFRLPHITDVFSDAPSMPSTFCLKMRFVTCFGVWFVNVL